MKKKLTLIALTLGLGFYATESSAKLFTLRVTDYGTLDDGTPDPLEASLINYINQQVQEVEDKVNDDIPLPPQDRFMEGMANSSVMAGKGIGKDYASNMSVVLIGAGIGVAADLEKDEVTDSPFSGIGVAPGLVVGANLGFLPTPKLLGMETKRLNMYFNFMKYNLDRDISTEAGKESSASLDLFSIGTHFRYDWIKPRGTKLLGWGGVKLHFGYEYNSMDISYLGKISQTLDETDTTNNRIQGVARAAPTMQIESATHSIPLEISTDVQLLYFLSLYTGVGADANFGEASSKGNLNSDEMTITCTNSTAASACGSLGGGTRTVRAQADADIEGKGSVNPFLFRGFAGVQINLPYVRIFGQVDKSLGDDLIAGTAGVRFVY
ncbi:MAG TPA: hypothetical protein VNJ01_09505 [Bacteriovoracaceae bacterium]|nr:hypothetical protein [Bacteriovoracaceae bacterium]